MPPKLLILTTQEEEAQSILAGLNQAGLDAEGIHCQSPDHLAELISSQMPEMMLFHPQPQTLDLDIGLEQWRQLDLDLPLILLTDTSTAADQVLEALSRGARDAVAKDNFARLALIIRRESDDLRHRRLIQDLQRQITSLETRLSQMDQRRSETRSSAPPAPFMPRQVEDQEEFAQRIVSGGEEARKDGEERPDEKGGN